MNGVALWRLYVLRAMYLFIVAGLAVFLWPEIVNPGRHWGLAQGQAACMLGAFSLMCALGLRYPLQMLPVLLWEITWKTMWLGIVPLPQWLAGRLDPALAASVFAISMVALVYVAVPWGFVVRHYVLAPGERWR
jgi:hypothetical protein